MAVFMMRMPGRWLLAAMLVLGSAMQAAAAVDPPKGWEPRSGDAWVDRQLDDINQYGTRYPDAFIDELVRYQAAPRELAQEMLAQGWKPGDLYYACAMAQAIGQSCRNVIGEWNRDHDAGWADVGKRLDMAAGTAKFRQLKRGFVASYDHWGRPIELDAELRRAFPDRGKASKASTLKRTGTERATRKQMP